MKNHTAYTLSFIFFFSYISINAQNYIAVIDLEGKGLSNTEASILTDRLRMELFQTGKFKVVEREMMDEILNEQGFQQSGCISNECIVEVGRLIGVNQIIGGSVSKLGILYTISARIISVESGEILNAAVFDYEGKIEDLQKFGMKEVAKNLIGKDIRKEEIEKVKPIIEKEKTTESKNQIIETNQNIKKAGYSFGVYIGYPTLKSEYLQDWSTDFSWGVIIETPYFASLGPFNWGASLMFERHSFTHFRTVPAQFQTVYAEEQVQGNSFLLANKILLYNSFSSEIATLIGLGLIGSNFGGMFGLSYDYRFQKYPYFVRGYLSGIHEIVNYEEKRNNTIGWVLLGVMIHYNF